VFTKVEQDAQYPGGSDSLSAWLNRYYKGFALPPKETLITLELFVKHDGSITAVKLSDKDRLVEYLQLGLEKAVLSMPRWNNARQNGRDVNALLTLVIHIKNGVILAN
jgi:hypothetical protein